MKKESPTKNWFPCRTAPLLPAIDKTRFSFFSFTNKNLNDTFLHIGIERRGDSDVQKFLATVFAPLNLQERKVKSRRELIML